MNEYSFKTCHNPAMTDVATGSSRRAESRAARRQQLIEATMKCIGRKGIGSTTLGDVAKEAGLSQGIVNLHFDSKDNLLKETLLWLASDYKHQFEAALERAGSRPADQLHAVLALDFKPSICNREKLVLWFAFWGEVRARPTYRKICETWDNYYDEVVRQLCTAIIEDGQYTVSATAATNALTAMTDGLWQACLVNSQSWSRQAAMEAVMSYLQHVFPKHFPA
jgi:TetR/AcrR family transcriptional repressor of bet genes